MPTTCFLPSRAQFSSSSLVAGVAPCSERLGDGLSDNGPYIEYVVSNGVFKFRQNGIQFGLGLGGDSLFTQHSDAVFQAGRWHGGKQVS